ncbi:hypothetical protein LTR78_009707 [Recurvomyces mirabilis]|uniref:Uncharacterized protein n=2 Tax=Recurvomyces mirabilis TaxID=574656 RepID=A0AAE0TR74_9PEZI|nr:hypothetical protein LTR78_009707 [Recurvomyces mirabilis]
MIEKGSYGHNSSLNLENLLPDGEESRWAEELKGTIEFRQHKGSLGAVGIRTTTLHELLTHIGCEPDLIHFLANPRTTYEDPDSERPAIFPPSSIVACIEQNKFEEAARFEPEAVSDVNNKDYGLDASVTEASSPTEVMARCCQQACATVVSKGADIFPSQANIAAPARALVFEHIAEMYRGTADPREYWYLS